jgi:enamine deaminase RidA (YjgF/YER057c/UK114 family)
MAAGGAAGGRGADSVTEPAYRCGEYAARVALIAFGGHPLSILRIDPGQRFASAVVHGGLVFLAGHVAHNADAGVREQTAEILASIDRHLADAGTDKSRLLTVQVWLADIGQFDEMNAAWDAWVDRSNMPARATVEAKLASAAYRVEIGGIAAL